MLDAEMLDADEQTVSGQFGKEFAHAVFALQPGAWHGPIESGYGLHLVRVSEPNRPNAANLRKSRRRFSTTGASNGNGRTTKSISQLC